MSEELENLREKLDKSPSNLLFRFSYAQKLFSLGYESEALGQLQICVDGREDWMMANVLPGGFDGDAQLGMAIVCAVIGLGLILILDRFAPKEEK